MDKLNPIYSYPTGTSSIPFCNGYETGKETLIKKGLNNRFSSLSMPTYLDAHNLGNMTEEQLTEAQNSPIDEFGVTVENMLYNKEVNMLYCILDGPNKDAVYNHHQKFGIKCDWVTEVKTTAQKKASV